MKNICLITLITTLISSSTTKTINPKFAMRHYAEKNVRQVVIFACWDESDVLTHVKYAMSTNIQVSYNRIENHLNMERILNVNYYKLGVLLDMDCSKSPLIFNQFVAAKLLFNESYIWLTVTTSSELPLVLHELPLRVDSELAVAVDNKGTYMLYDVFNPSHRHGGQLNITDMGYWSEENGYNNYLTQYKYKRRQDLHGITLNFSTILSNKPESDLETYLTQPVDTHLDSMPRYHYALVLSLRDMYNFKINLKVDNSWGYLINGTFNGIIGDMLRGIVDASATQFQQRRERIGYCEYLVPTYGMRVHMFFRHPKKSTLRNPFLKPLEPKAWWVALNFSIFCWILLLISVKVEKYYRYHHHQSSSSNATSDAAVIIFAAISQQGASVEPRLYSGRLVFFTLFLWSLMMYQFYSASIVGSLLAPPKKFINNLWDLADSDLDVGYEDIGWMRNRYATRKDPITVYLHEKKFKPGRKRKNWDSQTNGMAEVSKGGYAFCSEVGSAYKIVEDTFTQEQICDLSEIPIIQPQYVSLITSRHSPFKKMFIYGLRQMVQNGVVDRLIKIWIHRHPTCPESFRSQPLPIGLTEFSPALFLVVAGLIIATITMAGEHLKTHLRHRNGDKFSDGTKSSVVSSTS